MNEDYSISIFEMPISIGERQVFIIISDGVEKHAFTWQPYDEGFSECLNVEDVEKMIDREAAITEERMPTEALWLAEELVDNNFRRKRTLKKIYDMVMRSQYEQG